MSENLDLEFARRCHILERENALLKLGVNELLNKQLMDLAKENACLRGENLKLRDRVEGLTSAVAILEASIAEFSKKRKWGKVYKPKKIITRGRVT